MQYYLPTQSTRCNCFTLCSMCYNVVRFMCADTNVIHFRHKVLEEVTSDKLSLTDNQQ